MLRMLRSFHYSNQGRRPAIVLVVVIALLALFAAVALSFVFYAESAATAANHAAQAQTQQVADIDPELLLSYFVPLPEMSAALAA